MRRPGRGACGDDEAPARRRLNVPGCDAQIDATPFHDTAANPLDNTSGQGHALHL
jgi:hypothetical protein